MNAPPIMSMRDIAISFAKKTLFSDLNFNIFTGDRICLIGKNGVGKTTLMKSIIGEIEIDSGERWMAPNIQIGYLSQNDIKYNEKQTIFEYISEKIDLDYEKSYLIDIICNNFDLDKNDLIKNLSGGQKRRVNLAQALIIEPDILLLDEPTNHLDLQTIQWLENYLRNYRGALVIISHDRIFLESVTNKIFWLRSGKMNICNHGYKKFDEWSESIINQEFREFNNLVKKYELEKQWLQTGVTARRKRNIGRLHYLKELQQKIDKQHHLIKQNNNKINISGAQENKNSPEIIIALNNISKNFSDKKIIGNFDLKIIRGERIGIIGQNGTGKSTFLKLITKNLEPDQGTVKQAFDIDISYFDQNREIITDKMTLHDVISPSGSFYIHLANGKSRHVCGYLKDFLFDPQDLNTKAKTLSGGQQNRLLLAKTLANPGNLLILDEPTNDLDMESLDILEEYLINYKGTLIVVSHDRDFLDNVVTSILSFSGNGNIERFLGNYSDFKEYNNKNHNNIIEKSDLISKKEVKDDNVKQIVNKISNKEKFELEKLPSKIEEIEVKIKKLNDDLINNSYNNSEISKELDFLGKKLLEYEERWYHLENLIEKQKS